jgi:GTPase involved in cell partitioning and DNA repair
VYLVDAADHGRWEESREVLEDVRAHPMMKYKPFVVVANKQDLEEAASGEELRKVLGIGSEIRVFEASVIKVEEEGGQSGVHGAVSRLVDEILERWPKMAKRQQRDMEKQAKLDEEEHRAKLERIRKRKEEELSAAKR